MIRNLYTILTGSSIGQGAIIIEQRTNAPGWYNAITWPNAKIFAVSETQLADTAQFELLETLPTEIFQPYVKAYQSITKQSK